MVLAKKVSISSDPANVLLSYPNACLSNVCSMNMRSFFDCSKNAISYKVKKGNLLLEKIPSALNHLMAPPVPSMMYFCANKKIKIGGTIIITVIQSIGTIS